MTNLQRKNENWQCVWCNLLGSWYMTAQAHPAHATCTIGTYFMDMPCTTFTIGRYIICNYHQNDD
jgi:hypothetical protein